MFKDFTEKARRAVFFARQEANRSGGSQIEVEDLLIGLLHEDNNLLTQISESSLDSLRTEIKGQVTGKKSVSKVVTMPLSAEVKKALGYARDESKTLGYIYVTTGHLMLGLLREPTPIVLELLERYNLNLEEQRERLRVYVEPPLVQDFTILNVIAGAIRRMFRR
jgi:ATP-dependent Clp protease ATP-binding subunit ClpC